MNDKLIRRLNNLKYAIDTVINAFQKQEKIMIRPPIINRSNEEILETIYGVCNTHLRERCQTCYKDSFCDDIKKERDKALALVKKYEMALEDIYDMNDAGKADPFKMWQIASVALSGNAIKDTIIATTMEYSDIKWMSFFPIDFYSKDGKFGADFTNKYCLDCTERKNCAAHACKGCRARKKKRCNCTTFVGLNNL